MVAGQAPQAKSEMETDGSPKGRPFDSSALPVEAITPAGPEHASGSLSPQAAETAQKKGDRSGAHRHLRLVSAAASASPSAEAAEPAVPAVEAKSGDRQARASDALAEASGLSAESPLSSRLRITLVALGILLLAASALIYNRQSLTAFSTDSRERNLVTPEEQSLQLVRLGREAQERGDYEAAVKNFSEAIDLTPRNPQAHLLLGNCLLAMGKADNAFKAYTDALRLDPKMLEARWGVAELLRARGSWREAYQEYQRIIAIDSQSVEAMAALSRIESYQQPQSGRPGGSRGLAPVFEADRLAGPVLPSVTGSARPLPVPPATAAAAINAPVNLWTKKPEDEMAERRAAAAAYKDSGSRYLNVGEYAAAIEALSIARKLTPEDDDIYYFLGSAYYATQQYRKAYEAYIRCNNGPYVSPSRYNAQKSLKLMRNEKSDTASRSEREIGLPSRPTVQSPNDRR